MNFLKNLIKTNKLMTIIFDYLISFYGFNFEREYSLINLVRKKNPIIIDIGGNRGESIKNFLKYKKDAKIYSFEPKKNNIKPSGFTNNPKYFGKKPSENSSTDSEKKSFRFKGKKKFKSRNSRPKNFTFKKHSQKRANS